MTCIRVVNRPDGRTEVIEMPYHSYSNHSGIRTCIHCGKQKEASIPSLVN